MLLQLMRQDVPQLSLGTSFPAHTRASPLAWCVFLVWRIQKKCSHEAALDDKNYTRVIFEALKERPDKKRFGARGDIMFIDVL
jgi:hypothetical protein